MRRWPRSTTKNGVLADLDAVDGVELVRPRVLRILRRAAPVHDELAVLVELGDARAAVAVADEERAVGQPVDVGRPIEQRPPSRPRWPFGAQRHHQLAVVGELLDDVQLVVDDPDVLLGIVGAHLDLVRARARRPSARTACRAAATPAPSCRRDRRRRSSGASAAPSRAWRPARRWRSGRRCCRWRCRARVSSAYGVHGFGFAGSGSSPRCAIQMRSGVSAYTAPTDPHVQPSCLTPSGPSGSGCGQLGTTSGGPNSSWPPAPARSRRERSAGPQALSTTDGKRRDYAHAAPPYFESTARSPIPARGRRTSARACLRRFRR